MIIFFNLKKKYLRIFVSLFFETIFRTTGQERVYVSVFFFMSGHGFFLNSMQGKFSRGSEHGVFLKFDKILHGTQETIRSQDVFWVHQKGIKSQRQMYISGKFRAAHATHFQTKSIYTDPRIVDGGPKPSVRWRQLSADQCISLFLLYFIVFYS